jgi:metallo-beta-lactamase family protein
MLQGTRELRDLNWSEFPVAPASIDAIVLTHAHLDHVGYLPVLVNRGFAGPVFSSRWTPDLARIVLADSGHLLEEEAEFANRHGYSKHHPALALYTRDDAEKAATRLRGVELGDRVPVAEGVHATFQPAGHILGSASVLIDLSDGRRILFSGDLGRPHHPILTPPEAPPACDVMVVESTYGNRVHEGTEQAMTRLADAVTRTVARGGTVVIPAFAVDRTEVLLSALSDLAAAKRIPAVPVYVDSPMALAVLDVYRDAANQRSREIRPDVDAARLLEVQGGVSTAITREQSMEIAALESSSIVISASGMATGGRVLHHLARRLPDSINTVILAGYQAEGTRGRAIAEGASNLKLLGRYVPVRAEVETIDAFSVHADSEELLGWMRSGPQAPSMTYIVHGEPKSSEALQRRVETDLGRAAVVPRWKETVRLD